jgi:hypothetical protein
MRRQMAVSVAATAREARCVETCRTWNERIRAGGDLNPSPLLGTALTAGFRWLQISCPDCCTVGEVDLATVVRHPEAPISSLVPSLSCSRCPYSKMTPRLVGLSIAPLREHAARQRDR